MAIQAAPERDLLAERGNTKKGSIGPYHTGFDFIYTFVAKSREPISILSLHLPKLVLTPTVGGTHSIGKKGEPCQNWKYLDDFI